MSKVHDGKGVPMFEYRAAVAATAALAHQEWCHDHIFSRVAGEAELARRDHDWSTCPRCDYIDGGSRKGDYRPPRRSFGHHPKVKVIQETDNYRRPWESKPKNPAQEAKHQRRLAARRAKRKPT